MSDTENQYVQQGADNVSNVSASTISVIPEPSSSKTMAPRTTLGKERSKLNALKHGLLSKAVLLKGESREGYALLLSGLEDDLQPRGKLETVLVENLAVLLWRKRRLLQAENAEVSTNLSYEEKPQYKPSIAIIPGPETSERLMRYETHLSRETDRTLNRLERLQRTRKGQPLSALIDVSIS